jgi:glycosyltransferase involved in cell wall biosynthesis
MTRTTASTPVAPHVHGPTIVLISHDLGAGGVQRKIADFACCLTSGCEPFEGTIHLLLQQGPPADPDERGFFDAVEGSMVRIRCRPGRLAGVLGVPFSLFCFWWVLALRPQRVIAFLRGPGLIAVMIRRLFWWRDMRVGISDDSFPSGAVVEQARGRVHAALLRALVRMGYSRTDWVAVPSEAARADLIEAFSVPALKIVVSPNWVCPVPAAGPADGAGPSGEAMRVAGSAAPPPGSRSGESASPGARAPSVPDDGFDLIYVGRLAPVKNLSLLVEILRDLREIRPSVRGVIVGGGPGLADLERQRARLGLENHLVLAGWRQDVTPWLRASRLFCLTSHHEGLPIAALEAMSLGLPVISTRYPGAEELVQDGETGFLCRDRDEFVDRVIRCLTQDPLRQEVGQRARTWVASRHGPDNLRRFVRLIVRD